MYFYIFIIFTVFTLFYSIYTNFLMYRKGKAVPCAYKMRENPVLFSVDSIIIILFILGVCFFVTRDKLPIYVIIYYIFLPIFIIQIITLNYLTYKKTKDKKIIIHTLLNLLILIITAIFLFRIVKIIR